VASELSNRETETEEEAAWTEIAEVKVSAMV